MVAAVLTALLGLDTALWLLASNALARAVAGFEAQLRAEGWRVEAGAPLRFGWPLEADLAIAQPSLEGGERSLPGGLAWRADRLLVGLSLLHPFTLRLLPEGREALRLSRAPLVVFSADWLQARVKLGEPLPSHIDIAARSLVGGLAASAHKQDLRLGSLILDLADRSPGGAMPISAAFDLQADALDLPDTRRWPLGARIAHARLRAELNSPTLPGGDTEDQARAWRDGGGKVVVRELGLRWGPLSAGATADLGLDQRLQPAGTGRVQLAGYDAALDALAGGGAISPGLAATAKAVLGLMAPGAGAGLMAPGAGAGALTLPFTVQDSTLSVGKIPVVRLSDVLWNKP